MKTKVLLLLGLFWVVGLGGNAQSKVVLSASYFGNNIWNPGLQVSGHWYREAQVHKKKTHYKFFEAGLAAYQDPGTSTNLLIQGGLGRIRTKRHHWFIKTALLPLGISHSFLPQTYAVSADGEVKKLSLAGRNYFAPGLEIASGKFLKNGHPLSCGINVSLLAPYNYFVVPLINLKLTYSNWTASK